MRLNVRVQPSSGRQEIKKISESEYKIFLKKTPEDNKANKELETDKKLEKYKQENGN